MDRRLLIGALLLLIVEIIWLLGDLQVIPIPFLAQQTSSSSLQIAGEFIDTKYQVRRRAQNSLVWQSSSRKDKVYYYDSVLTLKQSAAVLHLLGDTKLSLSENTLIVIEPQQREHEKQIRLRFSRGSFRSRSPSSTAQVNTEFWTIDAKAGSDLQLTAMADGELQLQVSEGEALVKNEKQKFKFKPGQLVALNENSIRDTRTIDNELNWKSTESIRLYSHKFPLETEIEWHGEATKLEITPPQKKTSVFNLPARQKKLIVSLEPGQYFYRLDNGQGGVSKTLGVEAWKAPDLHLLYPLPRDRVDINKDITFAWSQIGAAKSYILQISKDSEFNQITQEKQSKTSICAIKIKNNGSYYWRVLAVDETGALIPPLYSHSIFAQPDLLDSPQLNFPPVRQPAKEPPKDSGWLFKILQWLIPSAQAQQIPLSSDKHQAQKVGARKKQLQGDVRYEADFNWIKVDGADHYIVEIDSDPDFRKPLVIEKVREPYYTWRNFKLGVYYIRIAAGQDRGRMGRFTKVRKVDLTEKNLNKRQTGFLLRSVKKPKKLFVPPGKPQIAKAPIPQPEKHTSPSPAPSRVYHRDQVRFLAGTAWETANVPGKDQLQATWTGFNHFSANAEALLPFSEKHLISLQVNYSQGRWEPESATHLPFQPTIESQRILNHILYQQKHNPFSLGLAVFNLPIPVREGLEKIKVSQEWSFGPAVQMLWVQRNQFQFRQTLSNVYGQEILDFYLSSIVENRWPVGGQNIIVQFFTDIGLSQGTGLLIQPGLRFGIAW